MSFIERLESRELLSAVNISHGAIIVTGSNGNDVLTISLTPGNKKIAINYWEVAHMQNPTFKVIKAKGIKKIQVDMRGGDDSAGVSVANLPIRINIKGGTGNDELGADVKRGAVLDGGAGNDVINGGRGNDRLVGGAGNDNMGGGAGDDVIIGGAGNNNLKGEAGNDVLDGKNGTWDTFSGDDGNDTAKADNGDGMDYGGAGLLSQADFMRIYSIENLS
jgi:hypothetical protein